jgi:hypothetical protein
VLKHDGHPSSAQSHGRPAAAPAIGHQDRIETASIPLNAVVFDG